MSGEKTPVTRLCHIQKWAHFDGYGFNLHAEKGKPGQYIGKVDGGSPAEAAGLRQGDRILEVNGESIAGKTHKQCVELIKSHAGETKLLVAEPDEDDPQGGIISTEASQNGSEKSPEKHAEAPKNGSDKSPEKHVEAPQNGSDKSPEKHTETPQNGSDKNSEKHAEALKGKEQENGQLNLSMTAAELRAKLASRKKFDPKKEAMDFKKKFDIVQKL
ncbi:unnamed protein product [Phaedon cochleariae]|uniref:PDZ domain-containing protein n=1 Tax=Phaedon cochleariae TaxID=80249 RepID=A0A9N9SE81_PHACE|nr:unnamed protein product [Phaedon cochleariae]